MKTISIVQGTPEWAAHRAQHFNASDAPAMMGCSPYMTRTELLHKMHTGLSQDVDAATQRRFDDGHRFEALARPLAEAIVGEDLYAVTGTNGRYSASFDGLTLMEDTAFEHKSLNDELRAAIRQQGGNANDFLAPMYRIQMEHQLLVSGAERVLFMASKWNGDELVEERHCWYASDSDLRKQIEAGWAQFEKDLAEFVPQEVVDKPVAQAVTALPAVMVQVTGELALRDNFKVFEQHLRDFLANRLIREPKTDEDFVNLDAQIKAMKQGREALKASKAQMLAQVQPIDQASKTADMLDTMLQQNVSMAERLLTAEKDRRKGEIVADGVTKLRDHVAALNTRLGKPYMPTIPADFGGAVKGLKSLSSMEDKVSSELARAKIAANEVADKIDANLKFLRENAAAHTFLFADAGTIVLKAADDLQTLVRARIAEHERAEAAKLEEQREQIRKEEAARADREAAERQAQKNAMAMQEIQGIQQQAYIAVTGRQGVRVGGTIECIRETLAETEAWPITEEKFGALTASAQSVKDKVVAEIRTRLSDAEAKAAITAAATPAPPPSASPATAPVAAVFTSAPAPALAHADGASEETITLGQINERLAPVQITVAGLASLGIVAVGKDRSAVLYRQRDFGRVCAVLISHLQKAARPVVA